MLKTIVEKEIRDLIGSTKFAITFGACAFLIIAAFYTGGARYLQSRADYESAVAENLSSMEANTDWGSVGETRAFLPPKPLASLVSGVSNDIGRTAVVRGRGEPVAQNSWYNENPIYAVFRFLDLQFLFAIILSLFAILLGYDAISGEKERGTLRLSFANAVPRHTYMLGKMIGGGLVLAVSLGVAIGIGMLLLPLMGVALSGDEWLRLGLIVLTGLFYFGTFLTLSVCVSALTQRSSSSFLVMLTIWIAAVLIIPRVAVLAAGRAVDVPSVDQQAAEKAGFSSQLRDEYIDGLSNMAIPMSDPDQKPFEAINTYMDSLHNIRDSRMMEFSGRLNEDRHNRQQVQSGLAFSLARLSPMASLTLAMSHLANSSVSLKDHFYRESQAYSNAFGDFKREKTGFNAGAVMRVIAIHDGEEAPEPERIDVQELPSFQYADPALAESIGAATVDIGILAFFNLLFFAGGLVAFNRYDVR